MVRYVSLDIWLSYGTVLELCSGRDSAEGIPESSPGDPGEVTVPVIVQYPRCLLAIWG